MQEVKDRLLIKDLVVGGLYQIKARNSNVGIWGETNRSRADLGFIIPRDKFANTFLDIEYHWDSCEICGTASPLKFLEQSPPDLDDTAKLAYLVQKREQYGTNGR